MVHHGNYPFGPLSTNQKQADLLRYFKGLIGSAKARAHFYHVYGHLDDLLAEHERSDEENVNVDCDHLVAETALLEGVSQGNYTRIHITDYGPWTKGP